MKRGRFQNLGSKLFLVVFIFLLSACSPGGISTPMATTTFTPSPTFTQTPTYTLTPTLTPTLTKTPTQTPTITATPIPTKTRHPALGEDGPFLPWGEGRSSEEEYEKFRYLLSSTNFWDTDLSARIPAMIIVMRDFTLEELRIGTDGDFFVGTIDYFGEEYPIELKLEYDDNSALLSGSTGIYISDREHAEKIAESGRYVNKDIRIYIMEIETGKPKRYTHPRDYSPDEWEEIRSDIDTLLKSGGRTSKYYLSLMTLWTE